MLVAMVSKLRWVTIVCAVMLFAVPVVAATIEELEPGKYMLVGAIDSVVLSDGGGLPNGAQLTVVAWGHSEEAWLAVSQFSQAMQSRDVTIVIEYAEDAATCLVGAKTVIKGRIFADSPIPRFTADELQRHASTFDRFRFVCAASIPRDAPADTPITLVGRTQDIPKKVGKREMRDQRWYFSRTGEHDRGKWEHDEMEKVVKLAEKSRRDAERKARNLRDAAAARRRKAEMRE